MDVNPIYNQNKLKLGTFCTNGQAGATLSLVPESIAIDWPTSLEVAKQADIAGFEAVVPFARWKSYLESKPSHPIANVMDPFTWAAALAQATQNIAIFVTTHAVTMHPIVAAKQLATIDIISGGRLGLNVVAGWNKPELEMFGSPLMEHDERYAHLEEWLFVLNKLWTSTTEFDHHGRFFDILKGSSNPKPICRPPLMNAGGSERGKLFACEHADMCFIVLKSDDPSKIKAEVTDYKQTAKNRFGREVQVWINAFVVQGETQAEAEAYFNHVAIDNEDSESMDSLIDRVFTNTGIIPADAKIAVRRRLAAGAGGSPLVGTPLYIAERLKMFADAGIGGVLLNWINYDGAIERFVRDVLPMLEAAGLRKPRPSPLLAAERGLAAFDQRFPDEKYPENTPSIIEIR